MRLSGQVIAGACMLILLNGCASHGGGDREKAVAAQQARLQLKELYTSAEAQYQAGQLDAARNSFQQMLELRPDDPHVHYRLGTIAFRQGQYEESARQFEATIQADPKYYKAHYNLASIRLMQAENHFKYYAALVGPDTDISKVSRLIADLDSFTSHKEKSEKEQSLDQLAITIKK